MRKIISSRETGSSRYDTDTSPMRSQYGRLNNSNIMITPVGKSMCMEKALPAIPVGDQWLLRKRESVFFTPIGYTFVSSQP